MTPVAWNQVHPSLISGSYVRQTACAALAELGAVEALPRLRRLLADPDGNVRRAAEAALAKMDGSPGSPGSELEEVAELKLTQFTPPKAGEDMASEGFLV